MTRHAPALLLAAVLAALAAPVLAQVQPTEAEVRKVDRAAGKITLRHGDIPNLDMPPMTMVFQVDDQALLDRVQAGDKVRFTADKQDGRYRVLTLEPQR